MGKIKVKRAYYGEEYLKSLCEKLDKCNIKYRTLELENKIIAICDDSGSKEDSIAKALGITNIEGMNIHMEGNKIKMEYLKI